MKRPRSNNFTLVLLMPLVVFVGLIILGGNIFKTADPSEQLACVSPPNPTRTVTFLNEEYGQIMPPILLSAEEFYNPGRPEEDWHFKKVATVDGRDYWKPLRICEGWGKVAGIECGDPNGQNPAPVNWGVDQKALDLLFVDYSKDYNYTDKFLKYMAVYLKFGTDTPTFIKEYCAKGLPYKAIDYTVDLAAKEALPYTVDSTKIAYLANPRFRFPEATYTLFMYEDISGPSGHFGEPENKLGTYTITRADNSTKRYEVWVASFAQYLELKAPGDKRAYLYSKNIAPLNRFPPTSGAYKNLQLETFYPASIGSWGWWEPECKPAIYLYPEKTTDVHVTVDPAGFLTYSDPLYPSGGWRVIAHPDGNIESNGKRYPYLYYESKIHDAAITKPAKGYVVSPDELPALFSSLLPKLGLSAKETREFKDYWEKVLPEAAYYFVGIMQNEAIDAIEPLTIQPKADTIIRVRLYFEALDEKRSVEAPILITPKREGFVVAEWGGLVKTDKDHPFTCSQ